MSPDDFAEIMRQSSKKPTIRIVADEHCPSCGKAGSPKVCDANGDWHWKCSTPYEDCKIAYYLPGTTYTEAKLPPEQEAARRAELLAKFEEQTKDMIWISQGMTSRMIHKDAPIPAGWHRTGTKETD